MDLGLTGKIALVTGGSKGIGKGIARSLSAEGCRVALCARTRSDLEAAAAEITGETGNEVGVFTADLTRPEDAAAFVEGAETFCLVDAGDYEIRVAGGLGFGFGGLGVSLRLWL